MKSVSDELIALQQAMQRHALGIKTRIGVDKAAEQTRVSANTIHRIARAEGFCTLDTAYRLLKLRGIDLLEMLK